MKDMFMQLPKKKPQTGCRIAGHHNWSIAQALEDLNEAAVLSQDLVNIYEREISQNRPLNAYITETPQLARKQAAASDQRRQSHDVRPLDGIPIAIKDNFCTRGILTTAGSRILSNFVPTYESTVTQKLLDAGAVFLGKTNMDEFGMGSSTENSYFGPTLNPIALQRGMSDIVPGGSSGGSAAAVAANLCVAAIGTDTGGSIRNPASFCGVVGMKPTYGLCSRWGVIAYASSLDQPGVLTKTVHDAALLLDVIVGPDDKDSTSIDWTNGPFKESIGRSMEGMRIGIPEEFQETQTPDAKIVWDTSQKIIDSLGGTIVSVSLPTIKHALPAYYIIALSEASSNLARYDGVRFGYRAPNTDDVTEMYERSRGAGFGAEVKKRILLGTYCLSAGYIDQYFDKATRVRRIIKDEFAAAFHNVDVMIWPTTPSTAFPLGSRFDDPLAMYLEDIFTVPVNLAGLPALSLPIATGTSGLPLGLSIVGPTMGDKKVIRVADALERGRV